MQLIDEEEQSLFLRHRVLPHDNLLTGGGGAREKIYVYTSRKRAGMAAEEGQLSRAKC